MKSKLALLVAALLAFGMLSGLSACGSNTAGNTPKETVSAAATTAAATESAAAAETAAETTAPAETTAAPAETTAAAAEAASADPGAANCTDITFLTQPGDNTYWDNNPDNPLARGIRIATGCNFVPMIEDATKFQLQLTSGDLPDVICPTQGGGLSLAQVLDPGCLIPLDDLVKQYGGNYTANFPAQLDFSRKFWQPTATLGTPGPLYLLPGGQIGPSYDTQEVAGDAAIRWDYYKELGYPPINSADDFLNVVKQMVDAHPTSDSGAKAYGFSSFTDWGVDYQFGQIYNGWLPTHGWVNIYHFDATGKLLDNYSDTNAKYWKTVQFYNKAYQMGIFDTEGLTQTYDNFSAKLNDGEIYALDTNWASGQWNVDNAAAGKGMMCVPIPGMGTFAQNAKYNDPNPAGGSGYQTGIAKACKNPDKAMQLLNFLASYDCARLLYNGIQGEQWDMVNGKPKINADVLSAKQAGGDDWKNLCLGNAPLAMYVIMSPLTINPADSEPVNLFNAPELLSVGLNPTQLDFCKHFNVSYPKQLYDQMLNDGTITNSQVGFAQNDYGRLAKPPLSDAGQAILSNLQSIMATDFATCIMSKDDTEFAANQAKAIADFKAAGSDGLFAEYQQIWAKALENVKDIPWNP